MTTDVKNYFCSEKFTYLSVDLERKINRSCCAAQSHNVDLKWLAANPGHLFNTPMLIKEREMMLDNQPVDTCKDMCWRTEEQGLPSRRQQLHLDTPKVLPVVAIPNHLQITIGSTCNLTCVYCCKQYSDAWYRDINVNGEYLDHPRFTITNQDRVVDKLSQNSKITSNSYQALLSEMQHFDQLESIEISGGEPFLYNNLENLLDHFDPAVKINLFTGLGVDTKRLANQLSKLDRQQNIVINISAENTGALYEFTRYGNTWQRFLDNIRVVEEQGFDIVIKSVISNTTVFGLEQFATDFEQYKIDYQFCNDPDWLAVNVLDSQTKQQLITQYEHSKITIKDQLLTALSCNSTVDQQNNFIKYITQFASRRNLDMNIFPNTLNNWINHVVQ
jgi:molybdenum cofactor biosynthesis enzyme MoaA